MYSCHLFSISSASLRLNLVLSISLVFDVTVNRIVVVVVFFFSDNLLVYRNSTDLYMLVLCHATLLN